MKRLRGRLTYANVVSTLALFLVLAGGSAIAAKHLLPKNSVGSKQIKNDAVTSAKIKNGAVTGEKVASQTLGTVPSATSAAHASTADRAATADRAITAGTAANANTLDGAPASSFAGADVVRSATISSKGIVNPELSVGISQANVIHKDTGVYCINGLSPAPTTSVGVVTFGGQSGTTVVSRVENEPDCQTVVITYGPSSNPTDEAFAILLR